MSWYKDGSVNIVQGSNTVIGVGTKWTNPLIGVCAGQMLILKTANTIEICEIASVQSDTQLTLANQYSGASQTGVSYEIPTSPNVSIENLALRVSEMLNYYQLQMNGWQSILTGTGDITLTAPDGRVVTIKAQRALTEAMNNAIKKSGEENQSIDGSLDVKKLTENGVRVYSPNNKPTADDIGALAATKTVVNGITTYQIDKSIDFKARPKFNNSDILAMNDCVGLLSENGYQRLPNGLIIQWGLANNSYDKSGVVVPPIAFPNKVLSVYFTDTGGSALAKSESISWVLDTTSVNGLGWSATGIPGYFSFFAIGF